jgi:mannonate dehydratase
MCNPSNPWKGKRMTKPLHPTRRDFVKHATAGAAALATLESATPKTQAAGDSPAPPRHKTKIRIGTGITAEWLKSENDNDLRFLKQIGVDYVNIGLDIIEGYAQTGLFAKDALRRFIDRLGAVGLRIERATSLGNYCLNAYRVRPEGQREIDNLRKIGEMLAEAEVPVYGIQACQAILHMNGYPGAWSRKLGRGGYQFSAFDEDLTKTQAPEPKYRVTADQLWKGLINIYRQVMPAVEGSKTRIAMHGNDPPLYQYLGNPQILCRFKDFDRLFSEVPSKHNGITFCVGTRYESGEDIFEGIRHFGKAGKLFHVHFRNVRGTLPAKRGYAEVFVDEGDLDMAQVLRTLDELGYDGTIDYDHPMGITGDKPIPKQYTAFAVGYMRGLLQSLQS